MAELRARGQETQVRLLVDGQLQSTLTAIRESTFSFLLRALTESYLGEGTMRRDQFFDGIRGSFTLHPEGQEVFTTLIRRVKENAQRRVQAGTPTITIVSRIVFPNRQTPRIVVPEITLGEVSLGFPGRDQYVAVQVPWEASDFEFV